MEALEFLRSHAASLPLLAKFGDAMAIIVGTPPLSRKLRLPALVGLLLAGVIIGPHGLDVFSQNRPIADFFAELGKLLLMFFAGLEIDLTRFQRARRRVVDFGLLTTGLPLLFGTIVGLLFGFGPITAIVLGSLLASHTMLASPIVNKLGANRLEPVTVTVGATILLDTLSLLVFAVCLSTYWGGFSVSGLALQVGEIAVFIPLILFGLSRLGALILTRLEDDEHAYFVVMLGTMAIAGLLAQFINLPGIVGAFLAGLAVNAATQAKPAKNKLEFLGNAFFIPIFFIVTGFLIDPPAFLQSLIDNLPLILGVIAALVAGKFMSAQIAGRSFGYTHVARLTMWSLTLPQVAATLAAALVAFDTRNPAGERLIDSRTLNVVLVLMMTTSIAGPILTERFAFRLLAEEAIAGKGGQRGIAERSGQTDPASSLP
jgi:Kef-type K+ transport system membrane component KefB